MKKKSVKIAAVIIGIAVIAWFCINILLPRVLIYTAVQEYMPHVNAEVGIFNDFSLSFDEDVQAIDNGFISLKIPANMEQEYTEGNSLKKYITNSETDKSSIILTAPSCIDYDDILTNEELDNIPGDHDMENIMDGFEKIGKGLPDNYYNMEKTMLLVDSSDYSFWDINQGASFLLAASSKYILTSMCSEVMLYEREDIKAINVYYP